MQRIALLCAGMTVAALIAVGGVLAFGADTDDGSRDRVSQEDSIGGNGAGNDCATPPCEDVGSGSPLGICVEGTVDCVDTPTGKPVDGGDACILIYPPPPECADPDAPVTYDPPVTSIDDIDPNQCNTVHNIDACQEQAIAAARKDLSGRLGVEPEAIDLISAEFVQWPNACLGIEQPGVACAEVITPGFRIILEAGGQKYEYHTDTATRAFLVP